MEPLLQRYLDEELSESRLSLIVSLVREAQSDPRVAVRVINGNALDLEMNFERNLVVIQDILETVDEGHLDLPMPEFLDSIFLVARPASGDGDR